MKGSQGTHIVRDGTHDALTAHSINRASTKVPLTPAHLTPGETSERTPGFQPERLVNPKVTVDVWGHQVSCGLSPKLWSKDENPVKRLFHTRDQVTSPRTAWKIVQGPMTMLLG